jgi:hypothetical protein
MSVHQLLNAVERRQLGRALATLEASLAEGVSPQALLGRIASTAAAGFRAACAGPSGSPEPRHLAVGLQTNIRTDNPGSRGVDSRPARAPRPPRALTAWTAAELSALLVACLAADRAIKRDGAPPGSTLRWLVSTIARPA